MNFPYKTVLSLLLFTNTSYGCPFMEKKGDDFSATPNDEVHNRLRKNKRRMLHSLHEDEDTRNSIAKVIKKITRRNQEIRSSCIDQSTYDNIRSDIVDIAEEITNQGDRGHFFGGIVRLAAHDFMDFDQNAQSIPDSQTLGPDGCLDFTHPANAGLPDLWCDDEDGCPLKTLYDSTYNFMSKADFWVAAANGVIQASSLTSNQRPNGLELPFRWGRVDNDSCLESSERLPEPHGCSEVETTFIDRMGLSWRDAVALLGAHTLGRGDINFSGHDGTWVDSDQESTVFDKRFYEEVLRRAWIPRQTNAGLDWTWGGNNRGVMMLNTDICLFYDIPEETDPNCCTNTNGNCRDNSVQNRQCPTAETVRPEAFEAFNDFLGGNNLNNGNQEPFYQAYATAWQLATERGYSDDELFEVPDACSPTAPLTIQPSFSHSSSPTTSPTISSAPVAALTASPTSSPTISFAPVAESCTDVTGSFEFTKSDGSIKTTTCDRISLDKCTKFGNFCRQTCDVCDCLRTKMRCTSDDECCSGKCNDKGQCKEGQM